MYKSIIYNTITKGIYLIRAITYKMFQFAAQTEKNFFVFLWEEKW